MVLHICAKLALDTPATGLYRSRRTPPVTIMAEDTRKRIALTVTPEVHAALERFTEASGVAGASYLSSLLVDMVPLIDATTRALQLAKQQPQQAANILDSELGRAIVMAGQASLDLQNVTKPKRVRRTTKP